jgi:hypothetical protein
VDPPLEKIENKPLDTIVYIKRIPHLIFDLRMSIIKHILSIWWPEMAQINIFTLMHNGQIWHKLLVHIVPYLAQIKL